MSDYTPTTDEVRQRYKAGAWLNGDRNPDQFNPSVYTPIYFAEFDRWLAEVERAAAEKAILKLSGTKQAEAFENAVDIRPGKRKPLFVSVVRWLREDAEEYRREEEVAE